MVEPQSFIPVTLPNQDQFTDPMKVGEWLVEIGEELHPGKPLVEILLPGINYIVESQVEGFLHQILIPTDKPLTPRDQLALISLTNNTDEERA